MPDVFQIVDTGSDFFRAAAVTAAHDLGVLAELREPRTLDELASRLGVVPARYRVRALLDVLVALGVAARVGDRVVVAATPAVPAVPADAGWGALADVIRRDVPLPVPHDVVAERRLHGHLAAAGAEAASEVAALLGRLTGGPLGHVVDLGGGMGAYTEAVLRADACARVTLVDGPTIVGLAREHLAAWGARVTFVEGDITDAPLAGATIALLSNVLHLHGPATCVRLVEAAARAVAPGGLVAIKDLRVDDGRTGPLEGLLFALNMALYTEAGDVYETAQLRAWLAGAGLVDIEERRLETSPGAVVVVGRRR